MRAGSHGLTLLSVPLNVQVLMALEDGPMALNDMCRAVGSPPPTTARRQLRAFTDQGILKRHRQSGFPGSVEYELARSGVALLEVARVAEIWLGSAPTGPLELGSWAAKSSIRSLVAGWSSTVVRALAARPLSLTQLSHLISTINYPSLERRLTAMRLTGQIASWDDHEGRSHPYAVTPWLRRAIGPIFSAARWEREFAEGRAAPIMPIDIESSLLLTLPLLRLPADLEGTAKFAVEMKRQVGSPIERAGASARIEDGGVVTCTSRLEGSADAWVSGGVGGWLDAVLTGEMQGLEVGGDSKLGRAVIEGIQAVLLESKEPAASKYHGGSFY